MSGAQDPTATGELGTSKHLLRELGFDSQPDGETRHGRATVSPEMHAPGTDHLRISILMTWADTLIGLMAATVLTPRVPVTTELSVHLYRPVSGTGTVEAAGSVLRAGRSVFVGRAALSLDGETVGFAVGSFMPAPDARLRMPPSSIVNNLPVAPSLAVPFAERAGCRRSEPGVAVLPRSEDGLNSSNTVNGGLLALAAEEAVLSLSEGTSLSALSVRYLQPVRVGPAVARATVHAGIADVEVHDDDAGRLAAVAVGRVFG